MAHGSSETDVLQEEIGRLQNAVDHLVRSNKELKDLIQETGPDRDYKEAIEENIVTIAKYRSAIQKLEEQMQKLKGETGATTVQLEADGNLSADRQVKGPGGHTPRENTAESSEGGSGMWI
mmetsp:Transcript_13750/g.38924  ORF Transcript_13750/g.38924 Transcript_13750/m.38924 type:complete len:121 (+) Transcript_13750:433-795(+)